MTWSKDVQVFFVGHTSTYHLSSSSRLFFLLSFHSPLLSIRSLPHPSPLRQRTSPRLFPTPAGEPCHRRSLPRPPWSRAPSPRLPPPRPGARRRRAPHHPGERDVRPRRAGWRRRRGRGRRRASVLGRPRARGRGGRRGQLNGSTAPTTMRRRTPPWPSSSTGLGAAGGSWSSLPRPWLAGSVKLVDGDDDDVRAESDGGSRPWSGSSASNLFFSVTCLSLSPGQLLPKRTRAGTWRPPSPRSGHGGLLPDPAAGSRPSEVRRGAGGAMAASSRRRAGFGAKNFSARVPHAGSERRRLTKTRAYSGGAGVWSASGNGRGASSREATGHPSVGQSEGGWGRVWSTWGPERLRCCTRQLVFTLTAGGPAFDRVIEDWLASGDHV